MHSPRRSARRRDAAAAQQVEQPGRQVAADHVAVAAGQRPARQQAEADGVLGHQAGAHHRLLEIQQAEIVLAALADHHPAALLGRIAVQAVELVVDLALQVAGVGRDPDRRAVLLGPQRWPARHSPASCRRRCRPRPARRWACPPASRGAKASARGRGVVALGRPRLGHVGAGGDQLREPQARLARLDRLAAGRRARAAAPPTAAGSSRRRGRRRRPRLLAGRGRGRAPPAPRRPTASCRAPWRARCPSSRARRAPPCPRARRAARAPISRQRRRASSSGVVARVERLAEPARRRQAEAAPAARRRRVPAGRVPAGRRGPAAPPSPAHADQRQAARRAQRRVGRRQPLDLPSPARHNAPRAVAIRAGQSERGDDTRGG